MKRTIRRFTKEEDGILNRFRAILGPTELAFELFVRCGSTRRPVSIINRLAFLSRHEAERMARKAADDAIIYQAKGP